MPERRYDLSLAFTAGSPAYRGQVTLSETFAPGPLALNAEGLAVSSVRAGDRPLPFTLDAAAHRLTIPEVPPGATGVTIEFSGTVDSETPIGLYRSPLGAGSVITTHFEPTGARRMFPCRDRPDAKAVFALDVTAPAELGVISNMPIARSGPASDGRRRTWLEPTPAMSTYLLYLGIGPFEELERTVDGFRVIGATARGASARSEYLVSEGGRVLAYFSHYYGLPYPLPKMHLVGIPRFLAGAMENWGAITVTEPYLLVDAQTPQLLRQAAATVLHHEVAHQWFGNLVTLRGWDDLWLNESFATFASYKAREALFPTWESWETFVSVLVDAAMMYDALPHTHPVRVPVADETKVLELFDEISYSKGAAVLRMIEAYVGEEAFRTGVSRYLAAHQGANAEAADLWGALSQSSAKPVARVLPEWILRPGFPLVRARLDRGSLQLEQRRFSLSGASDDRPWPVPLAIDIDGRRQSHLLEAKSLELPVPAGARIVVGPGRTGFYRVRYEGALGQRLLEGFAALDPIDRGGLVNDALAFLLAGETDLTAYLDVLRRTADDPHPFVISQACLAYTWLSGVARRLPELEAAFRRVAVAQSERLGLTVVDGEAPSVSAVRERVLRTRVALDPGFARSLAHRYPEPESAPPGLLETVFMSHAASGGRPAYEDLRRRLREAPPGLLRQQLAGGLAFVDQDDRLAESLALVGTGEMQASEWARLVLMSSALNPARADGYWTYLTRDLDGCLKALPPDTGAVPILLQSAIPLAGLSRPAAMHAWVKGHPLPAAAEGAQKGLDLLEVLLGTLDRAGQGTGPRGPA